MLDKVKKRVKKREYLVRMLVLSILLLLLPVLILMQFLINQSYRQMEENNRAHLIAVANQLSSQIENEVNRLYLHANSISVNSRNSQRSANILNTATLSQNPYYFSEAISALKEINQDSQYEASLYYINRDWMITNNSKMTAREFLINNVALSEGTAEYEAGYAFLQNQSGRGVTAFATFGQNSKKNMFYIGIAAGIGMNRERVLILYQMNTSAFYHTLMDSNTTDSMQLILLDQDRNVLYVCGEAYIPSQYLTLLPDKADEMQDLYDQKNHYVVLHSYCVLPQGWNYYTIIPFSYISSNLHRFITTLNRIFLFSMIAMVLCISILIFILYRPIGYVSKRLAQIEDKNEFESIFHTLDHMTGKLTEKDMILMDFLITNMIHNTPIPEKTWDHLGIARCRYYGVATIRKIALRTGEQESLREKCLESYGVSLYVTDMPQNDLLVFLFLMNANSFDACTAFLKKHLPLGEATDVLAAGRVVENINDIHLSYEDCMRIMGSSEDHMAQARNVTDLKESVLEYIQNHYRDIDLSQVNVADYFGISIYTLSRLFRNQVGIGFSEYVTSKRIDYVKQQLIMTNQPIGEIANAAGYPNANYFSRIFRTHLGVSPSEYRNLNGK